jgi:hypothetical protein
LDGGVSPPPRGWPQPELSTDELKEEVECDAERYRDLDAGNANANDDDDDDDDDEEGDGHSAGSTAIATQRVGSESPPAVRGRGVEVAFSYGGDNTVVESGVSASALPREWSTKAVSVEERDATLRGAKRDAPHTAAPSGGSAAAAPAATWGGDVDNGAAGSAGSSRGVSPDSDDGDMDDAFPPELR